MEWYLTYERYVEFFTDLLTAPFTKNLDLFMAVRAPEKAHVLDHSHNWNVQFFEHTNRLNGHVHGDFLWRCYYEYSCDRDRLGQSQRRISRTGREVDYQIV